MYPHLLELFVLLLPVLVEGRGDNAVNKYLNRCLDALHHKVTPGPEGSLYKQCSLWKKNSCCQGNVTEKVHEGTLYKFNLHHCKRLSKHCYQHFVQDTCFYQCTPNAGPWIHKESNMTIRKERYFDVPLCESTCQRWWDSCKDDETCSENWMRGFNWTTGENTCPTGSKCRKFSEVFKTANNFCEKVWDHSWKVVSNKLCFVLWFDENKENPNYAVALQKALQLTSEASNLQSFNYLFNILITYFIFILNLK
ncbi:folate receptor gamma-like, partial [Argonauta hians]